MEEKIQQLSVGKAFLIGLGIAAFYYFTMYNDGTVYLNQIQNSNSQLAQKQKELADMRKTIEDSRQINQLKEELEESMSSVVNAAPEDFNELELMKVLSTEAKVVGASINELKAGNNRRRFQTRAGQQAQVDTFEPINVDVKLTGTYNQLMLFLSNISKTGRLITAEKMSLKLASPTKALETASPQIEFAATFVGYKYNPEGTQ